MEALGASSRTVVEDVVAGSDLDYVVLRDGWFEGFLTGMRCEVRREGSVVAEILLAQVDAGGSIGLILGLVEGAGISPGDLVTMKTIGAQLPQS